MADYVPRPIQMKALRDLDTSEGFKRAGDLFMAADAFDAVEHVSRGSAITQEPLSSDDLIYARVDTDLPDGEGLEWPPTMADREAQRGPWPW